eukprot:5957337-Prymnesium_polylepis.1
MDTRPKNGYPTQKWKIGWYPKMGGRCWQSQDAGGRALGGLWTKILSSVPVSVGPGAATPPHLHLVNGDCDLVEIPPDTNQNQTHNPR